VRTLTPRLPVQEGRPFPRYRFGPFEFDPRAGELRKYGTRIRVRHQPLGILHMLLETPGEVVLRDEIRRRLWPHKTAGEFDHSINVSIQSLRQVLADSAENPRYIETLPRRGYRFIEAVEVVPVEEQTRRVLELKARPVPVPPAPRESLRRMWIGMAAIIVLLAGLAWRLGLGKGHAPARNWTLPLGAVGNAIVSPDGTAVVYRNSNGLFFRRPDSLAETQLKLTGRAIDAPAWSPDGTQLAVQTMDALVRLAVPSGASSVICPTIGPTRGLSWGADGDIAFAATERGVNGLFLVRAAGGSPRRLAVPGLKNGEFFQPQFLPGGNEILFAWVADGDEQASLYLAHIEDGKVSEAPRFLRKNPTAGQFSPAGGGMLLYAQDDVLYAQKIDLQAGQLIGEPRRIIDPVFTRTSSRQAQFSVSGNGVLAWRAGKSAFSQLTWFDRQGRILGTAGPLLQINRVRLSSDDRQILIERAGGRQTGVVEAHGSGYLDLPGIAQALWLPHSSRILFRHTADLSRVVQRPVQGGEETTLGRLPEKGRLQDVSPDGKVVLFAWAWEVHAVPLDGEGEPRPAEPVIPLRETVFASRFSPDGKWIVYGSRGTPENEVYVVPFPARGLRTQISSGGGADPVWRGDGKEILYRKGNEIYSVRVDTKDGEIHAAPAQSLFRVSVPDDLFGSSEPLAVTRDGSPILFAQSADPSDPKITYVMTAWDSLLEPR